MVKLIHFDILKIKHFVKFITFSAMVSCRETPTQLIGIATKQIPVESNDTLVDPFKNLSPGTTTKLKKSWIAYWPTPHIPFLRPMALLIPPLEI